MNPFLFALVAQKPVHPPSSSNLTAAQLVAPVSAREAREAFSKVYATYTKAVRLSLGDPKIPVADRPVTRVEIVGEMARAYRAAEPGIRFTPSLTKFDERRLVIEATVRPSLIRLVSRGFVGKVSPLAVGPKPEISVKDFGDALGFFASRLGQLSHLPSPRWTPMLQTNY